MNSYAEWEKGVPAEITDDSLWRVEAYRLALFAGDLAWHDVSTLMRDRRTRSLSDQLYRAVGSISANTAEGYSRGTSKDRARFYEYALGSAREARGWYFKGIHILGDGVASHRMRLLNQAIRLLLTMVPQQRGYLLRENVPEYDADHTYAETETSAADLPSLLSDGPLTPQ